MFRFKPILAIFITALTLAVALTTVRQSSAQTPSAFGVALSQGGARLCLVDVFFPEDIYMDVTFAGETVGNTIILRGTGAVFGEVRFMLAYNVNDDSWSHTYDDYGIADTAVGAEKGYWNPSNNSGDTIWFETYPDGSASGTTSWRTVDCDELPVPDAGVSKGATYRGSRAGASAPSTSADSVTLFGTEFSVGKRLCAVDPFAPEDIYMDVAYMGEKFDRTVILRGTGRVFDVEQKDFMLAYNANDDTWTHTYSGPVAGEPYLVAFEKGYFNLSVGSGSTVYVENDGDSGAAGWDIVDCDSLPGPELSQAPSAKAAGR